MSALVALVSTPKDAKSEKMLGQAQPHANINAKDAFALAGVERFPENYGDAKAFEREFAQERPEDNMIKALAEFENPVQKALIGLDKNRPEF